MTATPQKGPIRLAYAFFVMKKIANDQTILKTNHKYDVLSAIPSALLLASLAEIISVAAGSSTKKQSSWMIYNTTTYLCQNRTSATAAFLFSLFSVRIRTGNNQVR